MSRAAVVTTLTQCYATHTLEDLDVAHPGASTCARAHDRAVTKGDLVALATQDHHRYYRETKNAAHAWCAYVQARKLRAIPGWVVDYLDQVAADLIAPDGTKDPETIAKALGLFTKGGGPSARERALTRKRDGYIRQRVALARTKAPGDPDNPGNGARRRRGATVDEAARAVGASVGLDSSTVKGIVYKRNFRSN